MADLTSGLTSAVFSPYSKMFIGGLSWQTSPGKRPMVRCHLRAFVGLCCVSFIVSSVARCAGYVPSFEVLYSTPVRHPGGRLIYKLVCNARMLCSCVLFSFCFVSQTALETILVNLEKSENVWWWEIPRQNAPGKRKKDPVFLFFNPLTCCVFYSKRYKLAILPLRCYSDAMRCWGDWIGVFVDRIQFDIDVGFFMLNQMSLINRALNAVACVFIFDIGTLMGFSHLKLLFLTLGYFVPCFTPFILYPGLVINPPLSDCEMSHCTLAFSFAYSWGLKHWLDA